MGGLCGFLIEAEQLQPPRLHRAWHQSTGAALSQALTAVRPAPAAGSAGGHSLSPRAEAT